MEYNYLSMCLLKSRFKYKYSLGHGEKVDDVSFSSEVWPL